MSHSAWSGEYGGDLIIQTVWKSNSMSNWKMVSLLSHVTKSFPTLEIEMLSDQFSCDITDQISVSPSKRTLHTVHAIDDYGKMVSFNNKNRVLTLEAPPHTETTQRLLSVI